ncbi:aspartate carbamoyltransferase catalytic subunit [Alkalibacillus aidingensis]|uniref:aspartate carbamoyltransferase catalytic subunit n=1 Tax=Alkalibacillus aidingensis TaxID=2747607 RepID=UPI002948C485|nr:aspartate carbamoyltransferase catalytic subunit [Alkalibacillus aidingensis]
MHLLTMNDLTNDEINYLLDQAQLIIDGQSNQYEFKLTGSLLFYEPSTRTKLSFEMACHQMNINLLSFSKETSSVTKGESLYDTVKTIESLGADFIVIRHPDEQFYEGIYTDLHVPLINAGDGTGEHPSQSLLDLLTIKQEFGGFNGLSVAICGDIKHSRVAKSNARVLHRLGADVVLVAEEEWQDPTLPYPYIAMDEAIKQVDVLMLLRVQKERHKNGGLVNSHSYLQQYGLTKDRERKMKPRSIILHPAPVNRGVEIDSELVECDRSRIFKQMNNGVYIRQAIIDFCIQKGGVLHENHY